MTNIFKVDKEFILEAYKAACNTWKEKLRKQFPEVFKTKVRKTDLVIFQEWKNGVDNGKKEFHFAVGDIVVVRDGSHNIDIHDKHRHGIDPLFQNTAKVIATNTGKVFDSIPFLGYKVTVNLLLQFPTGELVYCSPVCVHIIIPFEEEVDLVIEEKW